LVRESFLILHTAVQAFIAGILRTRKTRVG
jgi:hypothetical protein